MGIMNFIERLFSDVMAAIFNSPTPPPKPDLSRLETIHYVPRGYQPGPRAKLPYHRYEYNWDDPFDGMSRDQFMNELSDDLDEE